MRGIAEPTTGRTERAPGTPRGSSNPSRLAQQLAAVDLGAGPDPVLADPLVAPVLELSAVTRGGGPELDDEVGLPLADAVRVVPLVVTGIEEPARREVGDDRIALAEQVDRGTPREVGDRARPDHRDPGLRRRSGSDRERTPHHVRVVVDVETAVHDPL